MLDLRRSNCNGIRMEAGITLDDHGQEVLSLHVTTRYAGGRRRMITVIPTAQAPTQEALAQVNAAIATVTNALFPPIA